MCSIYTLHNNLTIFVHMEKDWNNRNLTDSLVIWHPAGKGVVCVSNVYLLSRLQLWIYRTIIRVTVAL